VLGDTSPRKHVLTTLKDLAGRGEPLLVLPVGRPPIVLLRPIGTSPNQFLHEDALVLTNWRNRFVTSFLTEFEATLQRTINWLISEVAANENKILFMVESLAGDRLGYLGLDQIDWEKGHGEADSVVRGVENHQGFMGQSLCVLMQWALSALGLKQINVRVLADNPALGFYSHIGFFETGRVPLRKVHEGRLVRWYEDTTYDQAHRYLVYMTWNGPGHYRRS